MKKRLNRRKIMPLCVSALLALEVLLLTDAVAVSLGGETPLILAVAMLAVLTVVFLLLARKNYRQLAMATVMIPVLLGVLTASSVLCWSRFSKHAVYQSNDAGKHRIFGDRRVMLIVPHQDDDLNILGGVLEEYTRYGSELYPVFLTNGDYYGLTQTRYEEAVRVFEALNVPEDHVIFLGYGDSWREGHIYNAEPGAVMESYIGRTETYGTEAHSAYREGREYTVDNLMEDLKSVILEYRPDVIFCSDYDHHIDHKATTLLFEKVMGRILKDHREYRPTVYKAYAYGTAWEAEPDFYEENILSTQNLFAEPYGQKPAVYRWEDRVRFPVKGDGLSRSLVSSEGYALLDLYASQDAICMSAGIINGDKVAWQRHTDSLCLNAEIHVTSGNGGLLNDFMLLENSELVDAGRKPYDGVWIPAPADSERTATVTLENTGPVYSVVLYDHPSEEHNVLNAVIRFDDGTQQETGPLDPNGAATAVVVEKENVSAFSVELLDVQGDSAGLAEIEAFDHQPETDGRFIKLMDREDNFLYDYVTEPDGNVELELYTHGDLPELTPENYSVETTWDLGTAVLEDGTVRVHCPRGETLVLNISCNAAGVSDSIYIRNPNTAERLWNKLWQNAEEAVYTCYRNQGQKRLLIPSAAEKVKYVIKHML